MELLLCLASSLWDPAETVSARLNLRNGTIDVRGVCNFLSSVSSRQKFEETDGAVLQPLNGPVLQLNFI